MYRVFNMGVGFVTIVASADADRTLQLIDSAGYRGIAIGKVTDEAGVVRIAPAGLVGRLADGESSFRPAAG
jgi:phosphoribosylformylglycinamidine cyclo-ligase